jgi:hypothetical protein
LLAIPEILVQIFAQYPVVPKRLLQSRSIIHQAKVIITPMEPPDRLVSISELRRNTGERGARMYVAYEGFVYDMADFLLWKSGCMKGCISPART